MTHCKPWLYLVSRSNIFQFVIDCRGLEKISNLRKIQLRLDPIVSTVLESWLTLVQSYCHLAMVLDNRDESWWILVPSFHHHLSLLIVRWIGCSRTIVRNTTVQTHYIVWLPHPIVYNRTIHRKMNRKRSSMIVIIRTINLFILTVYCTMQPCDNTRFIIVVRLFYMRLQK